MEQKQKTIIAYLVSFLALVPFPIVPALPLVFSFTVAKYNLKNGFYKYPSIGLLVLSLILFVLHLLLYVF